mgnify:CR=1 FL=1
MDNTTANSNAPNKRITSDQIKALLMDVVDTISSVEYQLSRVVSYIMQERMSIDDETKSLFLMLC